MNRLFRPTVVAALVGGLASPALAEVEIGGTAGIHLFSETNELGVPDVMDAPSQRNSALFGLRIGAYFTDMLGVEGELGVVPSESRSLVFDIWNLTYRAHVVAQFRAANPENKLIPFALLGAGAFSVVDTANPSAIDKDTDEMLYAGIGAKYRVDNGWGLRADARLIFPPSSEDEGFTTDFEFLVSIYKEFGRKKAVEKAEPAPDPDPDQDGILGEADQCPTDAEDKDGFQDDDGCPDGDNDSDGIADAQDQCANEPEDKDGFQDEDGCPDLDNDADGVPDAQDQCAAEPETKNGYQDEDGCPDELPQKVKQFTGTIEGINFKAYSADLTAGSNRVLDKAVAVLKEYPDLRVEIQGHTDDQPIKNKKLFQDNQALSQARADKVKEYFVKKGIDESRITSIGYGDSKPVVDPTGLKGGKLNTARAKNRRVEFQLISTLQPGSAGQAAPAAPEAAPAAPEGQPAPAAPEAAPQQ